MALLPFTAVVRVLVADGPLVGLELDQRCGYPTREGAAAHVAALPAGAVRPRVGIFHGFTVVDSFVEEAA